MSRKPALHFTLMASLLLSIVILLTIQACNSADNTAQTSSEDTNTPGIEKPLGKHTQAPNFTLPDLDGVNHNLHDWIGKVIVLNFWATWCPPCRKETPLFVELQEQYADKGLQFIGVAIDTKDKVQDFMDTFGVNYPMLIGANDAVKISESFGNRLGGLPFTVVIDRRGTIHYIRQGEFTREMSEKILPPLL